MKFDHGTIVCGSFKGVTVQGHFVGEFEDMNGTWYGLIQVEYVYSMPMRTIYKHCVGGVYPPGVVIRDRSDEQALMTLPPMSPSKY